MTAFCATSSHALERRLTEGGLQVRPGSWTFPIVTFDRRLAKDDVGPHLKPETRA